MHYFWLRVWPYRHALFEVFLTSMSIAGVWVGTWTARSWQWQQWIMEQKKQEFRELLSAIGSLRRTAAQFVMRKASQSARDEMTAAFHRFAEVASDRVFIAPILAKTEFSKASNAVIDRFLELKSTDDALDLGERCSRLHRQIRDTAIREISTQHGQRSRPATRKLDSQPALSTGASDQATS